MNHDDLVHFSKLILHFGDHANFRFGTFPHPDNKPYHSSQHLAPGLLTKHPRMVVINHSNFNGNHTQKHQRRRYGLFECFLVWFGCTLGIFVTLLYVTSMTVKDVPVVDENYIRLKSKSLRADDLNVHDRNSFAREKVYDEVLGEEEKEPMSIDEIIQFFTHFLNTLHGKFQNQHRTEYDGVWKIYHDYALEILYPWDREYLRRMPKVRDDDSLFLSIVTYRDENCLNTLTWAYQKAKNPEKLNVGLVQQNCVENCIGGILDKYGHTEDVPPDDDCHKLFCDSEVGREHCAAGRVRALHINEDESLGPYAARYFGSKLWFGEQWYVQMDAHMTFLQDWDAISIEMLKKAPSEKPVMSHYPPHHTNDLEADKRNGIVNRLCGAYFADSGLEEQIIRLGGPAGDAFGPFSETPRFAPYTGAGYFVGPSIFLSEVPFDPFLPWIFMGEEIIMSARL